MKLLKQTLLFVFSFLLGLEIVLSFNVGLKWIVAIPIALCIALATLLLQEPVVSLYKRLSGKQHKSSKSKHRHYRHYSKSGKHKHRHTHKHGDDQRQLKEASL
jgi:hypothetical protein